MAVTDWIWSEPHGDYYYATYDDYGQVTYTWAKTQPQPSTSAQTSQLNGQSDSEVPPMIDAQQRLRLPNFISGALGQGFHESLDASYYMRTGAAAREFFKKGRVFAMLHTETAGGPAHNSLNDSYTVVRFGETAWSTIRRFVVVSVRRNFVYALAIMSYRNMGTMKTGCVPREHTIVYSSGVDPRTCYFMGEYANGMTKEPIEVIPADSSSYLSTAARLRFGKKYAIEWNLKVKDVGMVADADMSRLIRYSEEEDDVFGD